ncbi:MAG: 3-isopropylmalate dehydratase large subunit [Gammaproteobacteria bacterium AqS3]|nr:3-isopropylmalate dehydratase large subunit [Gammaproteobacteria bacterium AqS3]
MSRTLFEKLWDAHQVARAGGNADYIYIDRMFLHERMGSVALRKVLDRGRRVRAPKQVYGTIDHIVDTRPGRGGERTQVPGGEVFIRAMRKGAERTGIHFYDLDDRRQGIVHVVAAEQGIALPGMTLVCPDSHTSTLGALGALCWGIGISEAEHALVTRTLKVARPQTMQVRFEGELGRGIGAKDLALHLIRSLGADGGRGCALEYAGSAVQGLDMSGRFTLCNMAVEFAAFSALIGFDDKTGDYVKNRTPSALDGTFSDWVSDPGAAFDRSAELDVSGLAPMVTWGTNPEQGVAIDEAVPSPLDCPDIEAAGGALHYMGLTPGERIQGKQIDYAFIGSCTNARIEDLRAAAEILRGRRIREGVQGVCVPGSSFTKRQAELEGLDRIFIDAGFEWRESGCSMCFYAGGESAPPGARSISTSNRNFEGRQGPGVRTHLAGPQTVAASAVRGRIADPREFLK